jgi:hypothetical protein
MFVSVVCLGAAFLDTNGDDIDKEGELLLTDGPGQTLLTPFIGCSECTHGPIC